MLGETIGNFKIVSRLGRGGMGEVWLAEQRSIGTKVAIKLLHEDVSSDDEHVQRFFNEARAVSRIQHAGITKIFDVGTYEGRAYLIMEYLDGETLARRIARPGRVGLAQLVEVGRQISSVLDATHSAGITHRDLKPDNIFLVPDRELARGERVKVLDFGIAKLSGTLAAASPRTIGAMGTPTYMAPEQWGDASKVDWRVDLYSLGCVLFEIACGRPPFVVATVAEACGMHLYEPPPLASSIVPAIPPALDRLIATLLAKEPGARPGSMREVSRAFEMMASVDSSDGVAATVSTIDVTPRGSPTTARAARPVVRTAAIALIVAAAGGGGYLTATRNRGPAPVPHADAAAAAALITVTSLADAGPSPGPDAGVPDATRAAVANVMIDAGVRAHVAHPVEGSLDRYEVVRRIMAHYNELHRCYPSEGKVVAKFTIGLDGHVTRIEATGMPDEVTSCVVAVIQNLEYPKPVGGPVEISFPFTSGPEAAAVDAGQADPLGRDGIIATFHKVEPQLDECAARNTIHGKIASTIAVSRAGKVTSVGVGDLSGTPFASCIEAVLQAARFPPGPSAITITVPMVFQ